LWYLYRMGRKMTGARGMTIGTVLLLVTVGSLAVFTLVAVAFFHMRFSNVVVNQRSARNMAESALATGLSEIWKQEVYGKERRANQYIHLKSSSGDGAEGFLSFHKGKASEFEVPFSTNNFQEKAAVEGGNGRKVPDSTVHLVAKGVCNGATYKAECLYYIPPYPNAMASSGPVVSTGGLLVAGLPSAEDIGEVGGPGGLDTNKLAPGHIISNSPAGQAIYVGPGSEVRGDLIAVGGIKVGAEVNILGEVRPNAVAQTVPKLDVDQIFTKLEGVGTRDEILDPQVPDGTVVDYFTEAKAPLTVRGDLVLDGGVLYCRDDLVVQGQVTGNGAIFCLGDLKIDTGADLTATDQIALVAKGSLELQGASRESQFFNGLVYSEEEILASNITIIGSAVVNGDKDSLLEMDNVSLIKTPLSVEIVVGKPNPGQVAPPNVKPSSSGGFTLGWGEKKKTKYDLSSLEKELLGGFALSGTRIPSLDGEDKFSLDFEASFEKMNPKIRTIDDLSPDEQSRLKLDEYPYKIRDGRISVFFPSQRFLTRDEAIEVGNRYQQEVSAMLPTSVEYTKIVETEEKSWFGLSKDKDTKKTTQTFNPRTTLQNVDIGNYLDGLVQPDPDDNTYIDLTLNQVLDPAEASRVLLWQRF